MDPSAVTAEFDQWARSGRDEAMERGHGRFTLPLLEAWGLTAADRVLDLGCGNGWAVRQMIALGAGAGTGGDLSTEMLERARPPGTYLHAPVDRLPLPDAHFTRLLSVECIYYTPDPGRTLAEWRRVAAPGARLAVLIDVYAANPLSEVWGALLPFDLHVLDEARWAALARDAGWRDVRTRRLVDPRPLEAEADFVPDAWTPSYALHRAFRQAGTLAIEAVR